MAKQPPKSSSKEEFPGAQIPPPKSFKVEPIPVPVPLVAPPAPQSWKEYANNTSAPLPTKAPLKYDWLSIPRGMFNLTDAGVEFRDEEGGLRNKALALQYRGLLASGYRLHSFVPNGGEVFLVFEKA